MDALHIAPPPPDDVYWTLGQVAAVLQVSVRTVRSLMRSRFAPLPYSRIGKLVRFKPSDVHDFMAARVPTARRQAA